MGTYVDPYLPEGARSAIDDVSAILNSPGVSDALLATINVPSVTDESYKLRLLAGSSKESLAKHHIFPKLRGGSSRSDKYRQFFQKHNIDVDAYAVQIPVSLHKHIHRAGNNWVTRWQEWIDANPNATTKEVYQFAGQLMEEYGLNNLQIIPYRQLRVFGFI